ncbi:hypothetical protein B0H13DRAFT_2012898 [Mycena leptocephala]|nr:hypothetical protein B0H13DRAFT_2012898 [Mycena leptocephala]
MQKNDSHLRQLALLIVFFSLSQFPFAFPFPISPGLPLAITCPHMLGCAGPGPLLLWMRVPVMLVVVGRHARKGGRWADSNLGGDSMPADSVACVRAE